MTVLVLTRPLDAVADLVIMELNERGVAVHRLDPGDFPEHLAMAARIDPGLTNWAGTLRGQHRDLSLDQVHAVYYRRPSPFRIHQGLCEQDAQWAREEARAGFTGLIAALDCTWVNHPHRNAEAGTAPVALAAAARCGLTVPRTLITNDPAQAREFITTLPGRIAAYKALGISGPSDRDGQPHALWTNRIRAEEIDASVTHTAHQFQEWIDKAYEIRLTVVDGRMFAAEIHAGSDAARIDFRSDYDSLTYKPCTVPDTIAHGVRALMDRFGLRYAAMDFLVNQHDRWHLVDVNPNGQFGFIPELRDPITQALADLLEGPRT